MNYKDKIRAYGQVSDGKLSMSGDTFNRRQFIKLSAASGFALGIVACEQADQVEPQTTVVEEVVEPVVETSALAAHQQPREFVQISLEGKITIQINRLEFGQGTHTGLARILAEELDADWSQVDAQLAVAGDAYKDPTSGLQITGGSSAIKNSYTQYRELGARARQMLVAAAAQEWAVSVDKVSTDNGVLKGPEGKQASYGEMAEAAMQQAVPETVTLKSPKNFYLIGDDAERLDTKAKSTGVQQFGIDVNLPGQKTVLIARPPYFGGTVASFDKLAAIAVTGVAAVFIVDLDYGASGIAVVADGYWPAKIARDALEITWQAPVGELPDSEQLFTEYHAMLAEPGLEAQAADLSTLSDAAMTLSADFKFPFLAHAPMEPMSAVIDVQGSANERTCQVLTGAQMPGLDQAAVARILDMEVSQVTVKPQMTGGGFGRRATPFSDIAADAARVMKAWLASGGSEPLKLVWSREDDIRGGYYRPLNIHRATIGLDEKGSVIAWKHTIVCPSILMGTPFEAYGVKEGIDASATEGIAGSPYDLPINIEVHHPRSRVPILWWRSVGHTHTAFVMETLIDEIASKAQLDPAKLRRQLLAKSPRHLATLNLALKKSRYGRRKLAKGHAWGMAVHESFDTVVAHVVDVSIEDNKVVVHKITSAVHCNLAINPRSIVAQIEGAALMGLSTTLEGSEITLREGKVVQSNFHDYTVARISEMPEVDVHIVPSEEPPTGIGEPGLPPIAPAIANAVFALTGNPVRSLPIKLI